MKTQPQTIGLFWGSDTGATDGVAADMLELLTPHFKVKPHEVFRIKPDDFESFDYLILGLSTWHDGQLQSDWDSFYDDFCKVDLTGKTVALFGLGDQVGYSEYFVDGMGVIGQQVLNAGGKIIGLWPTEGYHFDSSKAAFKEDWFCGLAIDEEFQPELTNERLDRWTIQIISEFKEVMRVIA